MMLYLDSVGAFLVENADVSPLESLDDFHHCFHLVMVRWDGACKVLESLLITQLRTG